MVLKIKVLFYICLTGQAILTVGAVLMHDQYSPAESLILLVGLSFYLAGLMLVNSILDQNTLHCIGNKFLHIFRIMRHEFCNHLQVLFSMIQLKKYDDALKYIEDVVHSDKTINHICNNLNDPLLICCLLEIIYSFRQKDINITVEILGDPCLHQLSTFKRKIDNYIMQFNKIPGNKDIKIVLNDCNVEVLSNALGLKATY